MSAATQVYYDSFDVVFFKLAPSLQARVEAEIAGVTPTAFRSAL
jgi:hypothetical protein